MASVTRQTGESIERMISRSRRIRLRQHGRKRAKRYFQKAPSTAMIRSKAHHRAMKQEQALEA